jgi:hypothetical protein
MKNNESYGFFWQVWYPLFLIVIFFWFALWYEEVAFWTYRMYLALLMSVFFNYLLMRLIHGNLTGRGMTISVLYVVLWEVLAPSLLILLSIFSIIKEFQFYKWNVLMEGAKGATFYLLIILILLFVCFLKKGLLILKNN